MRAGEGGDEEALFLLGEPAGEGVVDAGGMDGSGAVEERVAGVGEVNGNGAAVVTRLAPLDESSLLEPGDEAAECRLTELNGRAEIAETGRPGIGLAEVDENIELADGEIALGRQSLGERGGDAGVGCLEGDPGPRALGGIVSMVR